jgi:hypothetical protein
MASPEDHLRTLEGGVEVLEDYLLSSEMYWTIGLPAAEKGVELPKLTMGGLLMARALVKASRLSPDQKKRFEQVTAQIDAVQSRWQVAWGRKCQRSFSTRLTAWRDFIEEYRAQPEEHADRYPNVVRLRVMLQLLLKETDHIEEAELGMLATMDRILRNLIHPGSFVWEAEYQDGFPADEYWFLYGSLPGRIN